MVPTHGGMHARLQRPLVLAVPSPQAAQALPRTASLTPHLPPFTIKPCVRGLTAQLFSMVPCRPVPSRLLGQLQPLRRMHGWSCKCCWWCVDRVRRAPLTSVASAPQNN